VKPIGRRHIAMAARQKNLFKILIELKWLIRVLVRMQLIFGSSWTKLLKMEDWESAISHVKEI